MASSGFNVSIFTRQGGNEMVISSGATFQVDPGGVVNFSTGAGLKNLWQERQLDLAAAVVASASGATFITASGKNPGYARNNGTTDPSIRVQWSSAAGATAPIYFPPIMMPDNLSTAEPVVISLYGEGASANATNGLAVQAFFGIGGADVGSTMKFTSAPSKVNVSIASGSIGAGVLNISLAPQAHASGVIALYGAKVSYRTSS